MQSCGVAMTKTPRGPKVNPIIALRQANPDMVLREIGEIVGLTRERVRQILKREGLPTSTYRPVLFCFCGKETLLTQSRYRSKYCSDACQAEAAAKRHEATLSTLTCETCGGTFQRNTRWVAWQYINRGTRTRF